MRELTLPDPLDLNNLVSLPQEKQSALVLQWLTDCESFLTSLTPEELSQHQQTFQQAFLNLLSLPTPSIGHVLRNCLGRCFSDIFTRGDRRVLFDTVSTLLQKTSQLRVDKEAKQKHATISLLGAILAVAGDSVIQLIPETVSSLIKIIRASHLDTGIRAIAFDSLKKTFFKHDSIKDESIGKDLVKVVIYGLADKSNIIQLRASQLLQKIAPLYDFIMSQTELESYKSLLIHTMDTPSKRVRLAAAHGLASVLLSVKSDTKQSDALNDANIREPKKRRGNPTLTAEDDQTDGRSSPAPAKSVASPPFRIEFRELLRQLSASYARSYSRHVRSGVILSYAIIFKALGGPFANTNYPPILEHFLNDLASHPLLGNDRFRSLEARRHISYLLGQILRGQLLDEPAKMMAVRTIINILEKKPHGKGLETDSWPVEATVSAVSELAGLVKDLGSAVSPEQESLQVTFKRLIQHPLGAVQAAASWGLRSFVLAVPAQIEPMLSSCKSELQKHLDVLSETGVPHGRIALGIAQGLAAVVQVCSHRPLYFSTDVVTEIWTLANSLLQLSAKSDLRSSQIQIQVSWNLIGALMTSGAQFVKPRINQLLLLWQNALPRPFPRESMASRNNADLQYLLHVREKALAALYLFLQYNSKLLTQDTSKRIATMLSDTNTFVGRIPSAPLTDDARLLASHSQLTEIAIKVKMRVFRCYCRLVDHDIRKIAGPELLMNAISVFVESEPQTSKFVAGQQTIVTSFKSLNYTTDNYACGVSSYFNYLSIPDEGADRSQGRHWSIWDSDSEALEQMVLFLKRFRGADRQLAPIIGALENDFTQIYGYAGESTEVPLPVPPMTALVDSAIDLFSQMVLDQPVKIQESAFAQIAACISDITLSRNAGRKAAVTNNIVIALSKAFTRPTNRGLKGIGRSGRVRTLVLDILQNFLVDADPSVRFVAADAIGRLCSSFEDVDVTRQIKRLTDAIISNREPNSRAGFAFALGSILYYMGGMAAGLHLRTVLGLLLSLANDSHPTVHFWALEAMEKTISSSGLSFSPHVSSCLGALSRLILSDFFDPEDVISAFSNAALEDPTLASLVRCIDAIINVLGPDLASSKKSRVLICLLVHEMDNDPDFMVSIEAIRCMQHLNLFTPDAVDVTNYIRRLEANLDSGVYQIRQVSCDALYELIRKDVEMVFRVAQPSLPDELWSLLNVHGVAAIEVEEIIRSWVEQTALTSVKTWIEMCLKLLTRSGQRDLVKTDPKGDTHGGDASEFIDEAAAFSSQPVGKTTIDEISTPSLRWQGVLFALNCLRRVVELNLKEFSIRSDGPTHPIVLSVGDLIRAAFTASTSTVVDIRLGGLKLLHDLIKGLAECVDPDFPESTLLEQFQAQIGSALTPAFAADSSPEIAAEAISICAEFISSDIVKDVDHMGRLLKILVAGLVNIDDESFIGELKIPSKNARLLVRLAVLSAWAELQIQSMVRPYLVDIVSPHISTLISMWLETLTAYAKLQFEPDVGDGMLIEETILDTQNNHASKEVLLLIYDPCWLQIIHAVATLIELESEDIFGALDSNNDTGDNSPPCLAQSNYRDEPVAFFFVIYGLCFQTLLKMINKDDSKAKRTIPVVLDALKRFFRPSISGNAMYKGFVFAETTDLLDRLVLMESSDVQMTVIHIATSLAKYHPNGIHAQKNERLVNGNNAAAEGDNITDGIEQLLDLIHILILAFNRASWPSQTTSQALQNHHPELASEALISLIDTTEIFPFMIKLDLYGGIYSVYKRLLDQQHGFAEAAQLLLAPYQKFCQNLQKCINENPSATLKVGDSLAAFLRKLLTRLENISTTQSAEYEAGCFLAAISFTTISGLTHIDRNLFERFVSILIWGLSSSKMSNCSIKCFKAIFSTQPPLQRRWTHFVMAELITSLVEAQSASQPDLQEIRALLTIIADFIEHCPQKEVVSIMTLVLPELATDTDRVNQNEESQLATISALLRLASLDPFAFKIVLGKIDRERQVRLESMLRLALGGKQEEKVEQHTTPSISLTLDFAEVK